MVAVVSVVVAMPLPFVVAAAGLSEPPVPVLVNVTARPEVATALPYWSASCAVMVTAEPATGL